MKRWDICVDIGYGMGGNYLLQDSFVVNCMFESSGRYFRMKTCKGLGSETRIGGGTIEEKELIDLRTARWESLDLY